jgi:diguanylate cyclase (GGDEF)-like protein
LTSSDALAGPVLRSVASDPPKAVSVADGRLLKLERDLRDAHAEVARLRLALAGTEASAQRARHDALHDSLTGLPNRRLFHERLAEALARADAARSSVAVLFIDLDGFKSINDTLGHDRGDELLTIVAARLSHAVRASDLVSRIGGDEFACLPGDVLDDDQLRILASKLFDAVSVPMRLDQLRLCIYPSIGIARHPDGGKSAQAVLRSADIAMYRAKRTRSRYAFFGRIPTSG